MSSTDVVRVTTVVAVPPERAFELFTAEVDLWWRKGPRYRFDPARTGTLRFEGGAGGRFVEVFEERDVHEIGRVLAWDPPRRLAFTFLPRALRPGEATEVEVRFEPHGRGTFVTVEHRGWDALGPDHPVRHGISGPAFHDMMGTWWGELLVSLGARARGPSEP